MTDINPPVGDEPTAEPSPEIKETEPTNTEEQPKSLNVGDTPKVTYEERHKHFFGEFDTKCKVAGIRVAVAILIDPEFSAQPITFSTGHVYEQTQLACDLAKFLKRRLNQSKDLTV